MINTAQWEQIVTLKAQYIDDGYEAEEAEQEAAEQLGYDYEEDVLAYTATL